MVVTCDLRDPAQITQAVDRIGACNEIFGLVNNAGVSSCRPTVFEPSLRRPSLKSGREGTEAIPGWGPFLASRMSGYEFQFGLWKCVVARGSTAIPAVVSRTIRGTREKPAITVTRSRSRAP
jgi:NAD(P)-dependent dehydrogenase (short-subunit alcohol dehydrogenase family)